MKIKENKQQSTITNKPIKKDNSKVYFFAIAIAALVFTNIYFYIKFKYSGEKLYTITLQKENLQIEIDRIEAELDNLKNQELPATEQISQTEQEARGLINDLRAKLEGGDFTEQEYLLAKEEISGLKGTVSQLKEEMNSLKIRNAILTNENVDMENKISGQSPQVSSKNPISAAPKSTKASSLKVSNIHINAVQLKKDGDVETQSRARRTDKLQINFSIAENSLANMGKKEIYVRIINPKGNLIADPNNLFFVHGEKLQYTFKESINFTNNGEEYQFMWNDTANDFSKGAYTILLYTDNTIMGRSSIVLK